MKKRLLAIALLAVLMLTGCGSDDAVTPEATEVPAPTPVVSDGGDVPAPGVPDEDDGVDYSYSPIEFVATETATPVPAITLDDYVYVWKIDDVIKLKYMMPKHWNQEWGEHTVQLTEPVSDSELPARIAISSYRVGSDQSSDKMKQHLRNLLKSISKTYESFSFDKDINRKNKFIRYYGYSVYYRAERDGVSYRGFVIICNIGKWIYAYHYSAETEKFSALLPAAQKVLLNVAKDEN